jgi:hypothetical protein
MKRAATSIMVFGIYLAAVGAVLLLVPNVLLTLLGFPPTNEVWIRVTGVLVLYLAYYFVQSSRAGTVDFWRWTTHVRFALIFIFTGMVLLGLARPSLILLGAADFLGAIWTTLALRADGAAARAAPTPQKPA